MPDLSAASPAITLNFRRDLMAHIFRALRAGRSCAVIGLPGAGLSNALRFAAERRVGDNYLNSLAASTLPVYLETGWLTQSADLYREMIRQTSRAAEAFHYPKADQSALRYFGEQLEQNAAADDWLAKAVALVCRTPQHRLILILDEFDRPFLQLPTVTLRRLRQLRDEHKQSLCYVVGTYRELAHLAPQRATPDDAVSKFTELFDEDTYPLTPYNRADTHDMLLRKTFDWHQRLTPDDEDRLYHLTGGHAKLLAAVLRLWEERRHLPWTSVERAAQHDQRLRDLCAAIWSNLEPMEQFALGALVTDRRAELHADDLDHLRRRGLIVGHPPGIFSSLFEGFVKTQDPIGRPDQAAQPSRLRDLETDIRW